MKSDNQRKWQIRAAVLAIFLLGFLAGALTLTVYHNQRMASLSETRQKFIELRQQSEPRFDEIRKLTNERLQAVLTPEQWEQWQQMTSEMRQRRRQEHGRR